MSQIQTVQTPELVSRLAQVSDLSHGGPDLEHLDDSYIRKLLN